VDSSQVPRCPPIVSRLWLHSGKVNDFQKSLFVQCAHPIDAENMMEQFTLKSCGGRKLNRTTGTAPLILKSMTAPDRAGTWFM